MRYPKESPAGIDSIYQSVCNTHLMTMQPASHRYATKLSYHIKKVIKHKRASVTASLPAAPHAGQQSTSHGLSPVRAAPREP